MTPRNPPTAFARHGSPQIATLEFKAYDTKDGDNQAGPRSAAQAAQQGRDWDWIVYKGLPDPDGPLAYTAAQADDMFEDRGARTAPLRMIPYVNEGAIALTSKPPTHAGPNYGVHAGTEYGDAVVWNPAWYLYDQPYNAVWTDQQRLDHVVRQGSTGVFILDLTNATLRAELVEYYRLNLVPSVAGKLQGDAVLIDVLGPNNVPVLESTFGGPYTGYTKYAYVTRNLALVDAVRSASDAAAADEKLPCIPNGLVDGPTYADARTTAAGAGFTQRLMDDAVAGMAENFMGGPNQAWNAWKTNEVVEAHADMLVHAEWTLQKGILCCVQLWSDYNTAGAKLPDETNEQWAARKEQSMIDNSLHCCEYRVGPYLLGQAGLSPFTFRDDIPGGVHRRLDYPTPDNPGTPTNGRRRQFQSMYWPGHGRCFDRLIGLGAPLTPGYTKKKNGIVGMYWRAYSHGEVWFNNTANDRNVVILGGANDRYITFASATEITGGTTQKVPAHRSLTVIYKRTVPPPPSYSYEVDAATGITQDGASLNAGTTDPTVTGVTFNLSDGRHFTLNGTGPDFGYSVNGKLRADTEYSYTATFHTSTGNHPSTNAAAEFTTDPDTVAPTWVDSSPQINIVAGRVTVDSIKAYDYEGVTQYVFTRTGGSGGPYVMTFNVGPGSTDPYWPDSSVEPATEYHGSIVAKDAAGNTSTAIEFDYTTLPAADDPNRGTHAGPIMT